MGSNLKNRVREKTTKKAVAHYGIKTTLSILLFSIQIALALGATVLLVKILQALDMILVVTTFIILGAFDFAILFSCFFLAGWFRLTKISYLPGAFLGHNLLVIVVCYHIFTLFEGMGFFTLLLGGFVLIAGNVGLFTLASSLNEG